MNFCLGFGQYLTIVETVLNHSFCYFILLFMLSGILSIDNYKIKDITQLWKNVDSSLYSKVSSTQPKLNTLYKSQQLNSHLYTNLVSIFS